MWATGTIWTGVENFAANETRSSDRPVRSESLYGEPYRLGLAEGRLQAEACALELSSATLGSRAAIGCRELTEGMRGVLVSFGQGRVRPEICLL